MRRKTEVCNSLVVCREFGNHPDQNKFVSNFKWSQAGVLPPVITGVNSFNSINEDKRKRIALLTFSQFRKQTGKGSISYLLYVERFHNFNETIEDFNIYCEQLKLNEFTIGGSGGSKESTSFNVGRVTTINKDVDIFYCVTLIGKVLFRGKWRVAVDL